MTKKSLTPTKTFAIVGHRSAGKTTLGDVILSAAGVTRTIGRVSEGTSLLDHEPDERRRRMSVGPAFAWLRWGDSLLFMIDTPGGDGLEDVRDAAAAGADGLVVAVSAPEGVEIGAEVALQQRDRARVVALTKIDRAFELQPILDQLERASGARPVLLQLPFYDESGALAGVVCLIRRKVYRYDPEGTGAFSPEPPPRRVVGPAREAWEQVVEAAALADDDLLERYLEFLELSDDEVRAGLATGVAEGRLLPVVLTSGAAAVGADSLLDLLAWVLPEASRSLPLGDGGSLPPDHPGMVAQHLATRVDGDGQPFHILRVWRGQATTGSWLHPASGARSRVRRLYQVRGPRRSKATQTGPGSLVATWDALPGRPGDTYTDGAPVTLPDPVEHSYMMSYRLGGSGVDARRLEAGLQLARTVHPGLGVGETTLTGEPLLSGASAEHLEHVLAFLQRRLALPVHGELPWVDYRETPRREARGVEGVHRRELGHGVEEFGLCEVDVLPLPPEQGNPIERQVDPDSLPSRFLPSVDEGLREAMRHGPTAGYPILGAGVHLTRGDYDILFSTEDHLREAGALALRAALEQVGTRILEPWCEVEVRAPADEVGGVLNALSGIRGRIQGMDVEGDLARIAATVPYRELRTFAPRLQALTSGRGRFDQRRSHFEAVPASLVDEAIQSSPFAGK